VLEKEREKRERGGTTYNETIKDLRVERERKRDGKRARVGERGRKRKSRGREDVL